MGIQSLCGDVGNKQGFQKSDKKQNREGGEGPNWTFRRGILAGEGSRGKGKLETGGDVSEGVEGGDTTSIEFTRKDQRSRNSQGGGDSSCTPLEMQQVNGKKSRSLPQRPALGVKLE